MEEIGFAQPELVGREEELAVLARSLNDALDGKGSTVYIAGEAGIGKTRLVTELLTKAESKHVRVIKGWCLSESLEPLMPIKTALRDSDLYHLISTDPPPNVISAYLMNEAGMLVAKAEKVESGLDPDIFTAMLKAVGDFVRDSLTMMGQEGGGGLNSLGYQNYKILIQTLGGISIATVIEGSESEFLIDDMKRVLSEIGDRLDDWSGAMSDVEDLESKVSWFVTSGKYDGKFLVDDPKLKQENLFDNVLLGLQRASEEAPLVLFVDDLQWADPTTLSLLHYLARNIGSHRVFILGTYRPEDITQKVDGKSHFLVTVMQNMSRENLFESVELKRFDIEDTRSLVVSALGDNSLEGPFFDRVYKETEGTPFYVLEVLKLLIEDRAIVKDEVWKLEADIGTIDIPSKVYDVIKRRLDRLIEEQREILEFAAVIGEEFSTDILEKTTEMRRLTLLKNLSTIEKVHQLILYLKEKYRFSHAKVREVLYNGIGKELRNEYHLIVADTLEEVHKDRIDEVVSDLAYHYSEAGDRKAKEYLIKAGDKAKDRFANEEAIIFYKTAIPMIDDEEELISTYGNLGNIYSLLGDLENAIENYDTAYGLEKDDMKKVDLHIRMSFVHEKKGDYDNVKVECEKGLDLIGDAETIEKANLNIIMGGLHTRTGDFEKAIEYSSQGLELATKLNSDKDAAKAWQILGVVHIFKGDYDKALEHLNQALNTYRKMDLLTPLPNILSNIGLVYRDQGKFEKARKLFEQALDIAEGMGDKWSTSSSLNNLGLIYRDTGDADKALELFERGLRISKMMDDKYSVGLRYYNIGDVYMIKNELDLALDYMNKGLELFIETENMRSMIESYINLAYAHLKSGNEATASEQATTAVELAVQVGAKGTEIMARLCLGTIYVDTGERSKAEGEFQATEDLLAEVEDRQQMAGLHYQRGRLFKKTGKPEKAKEHLQKALTMFEEMGMKNWAEDVRGELREGGVALTSNT